MKVFARKQRHLLTVVQVPQTKKMKSEFRGNSSTLRDTLRGWLDGVPSTTFDIAVGPPVTRVPRLTAFDITRVNHATIREGESHCIWPPPIIQKFQTARVITEKKVRHYELKDTSLRKIG